MLFLDSLLSQRTGSGMNQLLTLLSALWGPQHPRRDRDAVEDLTASPRAAPPRASSGSFVYCCIVPFRVLDISLCRVTHSLVQ
ncbi:hypothetical protein TNCT_676671 [Trichonephila clavata]|uniref:Uncharacterized protein n=1 Tax=Trichonephila clavata TaxID=2740835 RepID=A0A8X6KQ77_TRICU|nr:hypothetical protein TNCT_676671 [Trichonephila clavata]